MLPSPNLSRSEPGCCSPDCLLEVSERVQMSLKTFRAAGFFALAHFLRCSSLLCAVSTEPGVVPLGQAVAADDVLALTTPTKRGGAAGAVQGPVSAAPR